MSSAVRSTQHDHSIKNHSFASNIVWLNIYDISSYNDALMPLISCGIFHSAIEIFGTEFGFGRSNNSPGVFSIEPQSFPTHIYRESIALGTTALSESDIFALVHDRLHYIWSGRSYHLLRRNCNHFSYELGKLLVSAPNIDVANKWIDQCKISSSSSLNNSANAAAAAVQMTTSTTKLKYRNLSEIIDSSPSDIVSSSSSPNKQQQQKNFVSEAVSYAGQLPILTSIKMAFCSSSNNNNNSGSNNSNLPLNYELVYPRWINRLPRFAVRVLSASLAQEIDNQDRTAAGMIEMNEVDVQEFCEKFSC